MELKQMPNIRF